MRPLHPVASGNQLDKNVTRGGSYVGSFQMLLKNFEAKFGWEIGPLFHRTSFQISLISSLCVTGWDPSVLHLVEFVRVKVRPANSFYTFNYALH